MSSQPRNAIAPAAPDTTTSFYDALLSGLRAAESTRAASVTATWDAILQTSRETVRPQKGNR